MTGFWPGIWFHVWISNSSAQKQTSNVFRKQKWTLVFRFSRLCDALRKLIIRRSSDKTPNWALFMFQEIRPRRWSIPTNQPTSRSVSQRPIIPIIPIPYYPLFRMINFSARHLFSTWTLLMPGRRTSQTLSFSNSYKGFGYDRPGVSKLLASADLFDRQKGLADARKVLLLEVYEMSQVSLHPSSFSNFRIFMFHDFCSSFSWIGSELKFLLWDGPGCCTTF